MNVNLTSPETESRKDKEGHVRRLNHRMNPIKEVDSKEKDILDIATDYVKEVAKIYEISGQISSLKNRSNLDLRKDKLELRLLEEIRKQSLSIVSFSQTYFGVPIWNAGLSLRIDSDNKSVIGSLSSLVYDKVEVSPLEQDETEKFKDISPNKLAELLGFGTEKDFEINESNQLYIYKYTKEGKLGVPLRGTLSNSKSITNKLKSTSLPENNYYLVREVLFSFAPKDLGLIYWRCFVEVKTGEILHITPFISGVTGLVFEYDPITSGANVDTDDSNTILNQHRKSVTLERLENPVSGIQELRGDTSTGYALITDPVDFPNDPLSVAGVDPPNEPTSNNFDYDARSSDFAAVSAYFNIDRIIALIFDLGITQPQQFPNTQLPLHANHNGLGSQVNAFVLANANETAALGIRFGAVTQTSPYLGMATSYRVTLHEFGHVLLLDHANSWHFGFAHSFGDSLAAIINDPYSQATDRFNTLPWLDSVGLIAGRRHDRDVSAGWAWDGSKDFDWAGDPNISGSDYYAEQILSTTIFRIYRALGGDSTSINRKEYAMRITLLLLLKGVQKISPTPNTPHAEDFADLMMEADTDNNPFTNSPLSLDNIDLGASHKVVRWSFEKQGAYQSAPLGDKEGEPPAVDVYIDDGRSGEYNYISNFWNTTEIINRRQADGIFSHEPPLLNITNYVYVRIKNRGTSSANGIVVKGYHCKPGGGLVWPNDWQSMQTSQINVSGSLGSSQSTIVGPFLWTPTQQGHECLLMTVSATGDDANTNTVGSVPHWALVPNDNNVAQRNVAPIPALNGGLHVVDTFNILQFYVLNPYHFSIEVTLVVHLPQLLIDKAWQLTFPAHPPGQTIQLSKFDREGILVQMQMQEGLPFNRDEVLSTEDRDITIFMQSDQGIIGGMTYRLDPDLEIYTI